MKKPPLRKSFKGKLLLILNAHLPFVYEPDQPDFLEEKWFFEALLETYLPLLSVFEELHLKKIPFKLAISFTPTLLNMFSNKILRNKFLAYLNERLDFLAAEIKLYHKKPQLQALARMYQANFLDLKERYLNTYGQNLIGAFLKFYRLGYLELMASAATHAYFNLFAHQPHFLKIQISLGVQEFKKFFKTSPQGFWLPECGFVPEAIPFLKEAGIKYFVIDTQGFLNASPSPRAGVFAPLKLKEGLAVFGRDLKMNKLVWSATQGYPGHKAYREFYHQRISGIKYFRVTGKKRVKKTYLRERALRQVSVDVVDFLAKLKRHQRKAFSYLAKEPLTVLPYDAELFGHWWYEGPFWLKDFFLALNDLSEIELLTPSKYLESSAKIAKAKFSSSSWGLKGHNQIWLSSENSFIYPKLDAAFERFTSLAKEHFKTRDALLVRTLNQALRELLMATASDWPFMIKTKRAMDFGRRQFENYLLNFNALAEMIELKSIEDHFLRERERLSPIFSDIDYHLWLTQ